MVKLTTRNCRSLLLKLHNIFHLFSLEKPFTVLIPSDSAFQRWHPIDWGFYPFSVFEFTESVLRNHFLQLKTPLSMQDIRRSGVVSKIKTLGNENLIFKSKRKSCNVLCEFVNEKKNPSFSPISFTHGK